VLQHHRRHHPLKGLHGDPVPLFPPGFHEDLTHLLSIVSKHRFSVIAFLLLLQNIKA
jgi:hypothetical protein